MSLLCPLFWGSVIETTPPTGVTNPPDIKYPVDPTDPT